jgi:hypothetical protein
MQITKPETVSTAKTLQSMRLCSALLIWQREVATIACIKLKFLLQIAVINTQEREFLHPAVT